METSKTKTVQLGCKLVPYLVVHVALLVHSHSHAHTPHRLVVSQGCMVTSISYRTWINREARDPSLLVSCADSTLRLYRILPDGNLYLKRKFSLPHTKQPLRSAFCPLMSFLQVQSISLSARMYTPRYRPFTKILIACRGHVWCQGERMGVCTSLMLKVVL